MNSSVFVALLYITLSGIAGERIRPHPNHSTHYIAVIGDAPMLILLGPKVSVVEPPKGPAKWAWITTGSVDPLGRAAEVVVSTSDGQLNDKGQPLKLIWLSFANKVLLPEWFTSGKEAQKLRGDQLNTAWEMRMEGVYKFDHSAPFIREQLFKGFEVEAK